MQLPHILQKKNDDEHERLQDEFYKLLSLALDKPKYPLKAYMVVNVKKLQKPLRIGGDDIIAAIKDFIIGNNIKHPIPEKLYPAAVKEILKRLVPQGTPFKILIAQGKKPIDGKNGKVTWYFEQYKLSGNVDESGKIDYRKKNLITTVSKGSVLLEVIKPTDGEEGYDIFGNTIHPRQGSLEGDLSKWKYNSSTIAEIDNGDKLLYVVKSGGGLIYKNGIYDVDSSIVLNTVDIRKTGNINVPLDKDISVQIVGSGSDHYTQDVIAPGMKVKAKKVTINGDVGPRAVIEGEVVEIKGSVHQDAQIIAKKAVIAICRGKVVAQEVKIDLAEHAKIQSRETAEINKMVACELVCPDINIKDAMINSNITTSSEAITINNVVGDNNTIAIQPLSLPWIKKRYNHLFFKLSETAVKFKEKEMQYKVYAKAVEENKAKYAKLKQLIKRRVDKQERVPDSFLATVRKIKETLQTFEVKKSEYENSQGSVKAIQDKIFECENAYKKGHIIIKGKIQPGNKIAFGQKTEIVLDKECENVRFCVREKEGKEEIAVEPIREDQQ